MSIHPKRVAVLSVLMLLPVTALAAYTGADGGTLGSLFAGLFSCGGGCPGS